jgi:glutathione S-transferase
MQVPDYTLYYEPGAASMSVTCTVEIGGPHASCGWIRQRCPAPPAYLDLNPLVSSRLSHRRQAAQGSAALMLILAERHPEAGLAPRRAAGP